MLTMIKIIKSTNNQVIRFNNIAIVTAMQIKKLHN